MPRTFLSSAPPEALFVVGPVFTRSRPAFCLSLESPVGHAASANGTFLPLTGSVTFSPVGQPIPLIQRAATMSVFEGSNVNGFTSLKSWPDAPSATDATSIANQTCAFMETPKVQLGLSDVRQTSGNVGPGSAAGETDEARTLSY